MTLSTNDIFGAVQLGIITPEEGKKLLGIDKMLSGVILLEGDK